MPPRPAARLPQRISKGVQVLATPARGRLARELGVDIRALHGSGDSGRVTMEDVKSAGGGGASTGTYGAQPQTPRCDRFRIPRRR